MWAHHQFVAGIDPRMANIFTITTLLISVPIAEMCFVYIATLYGGSITLTTPMLWALAFLAEFLIGGVTGIFLGASGADIYLHDTYFVLAHFHYTFVPIAIIGTFAGVTFWFPKMFGRMMNETLGKIHFWITIIAFNAIFIPLFVTGAAGDHRRIYDYSHFPELAEPELQDLRVFATVALVVMLLAQVIFLWNFFYSLLPGQAGGEEPVAVQHARVDDGVAAAARQLAGGPAADRLPRALRVQPPGSQGRLLAAERAGLRESDVRETDCDHAQRRRAAHRKARRLVGDRVGDRDLRRAARLLHHAPAGPRRLRGSRRPTPTCGSAPSTRWCCSPRASRRCSPTRPPSRATASKAARLIWATIGGAFTFLIVKAFEWTHEIQHGFTITSSTFWSFYYTAAGLHALHVLAGAIIMMFVAADASEEPASSTGSS